MAPKSPQGPTDSSTSGRFPEPGFGGNPFPKHDPRHDAWTKAARLAAEDFERLTSEAFKNVPTEKLALLAWLVDFQARKFDVQAKLVMPFFLGYESASGFKETLSMLADPLTRLKGPPGVPATKLRYELRLRLTQRSAHWMAEAFSQARRRAVTGKAGSRSRASGDATHTATTWPSLEIRFVSDERVQILIEGQPGPTYNYAEMGFEDRRGKLPNRAWVALRALAESNGSIPLKKGAKDWPKLEKRIQEIRRVLRAHFRLLGDPVPFKKAVGYRTAFRISCAPSFDR